MGNWCLRRCDDAREKLVPETLEETRTKILWWRCSRLFHFDSYEHGVTGLGPELPGRRGVCRRHRPARGLRLTTYNMFKYSKHTSWILLSLSKPAPQRQMLLYILYVTNSSIERCRHFWNAQIRRWRQAGIAGAVLVCEIFAKDGYSSLLSFLPHVD